MWHLPWLLFALVTFVFHSYKLRRRSRNRWNWLRWYNEAFAKNPEIQAARSQWEATVEQIPQATTLPDPTFGVQLWNVPQNGNLGTSVTRAQNTIYTLSQKFPFPGKLPAQGRDRQPDGRRQ